jgi:hypothetical protein
MPPFRPDGVSRPGKCTVWSAVPGTQMHNRAAVSPALSPQPGLAAPGGRRPSRAIYAVCSGRDLRRMLPISRPQALLTLSKLHGRVLATRFGAHLPVRWRGARFLVRITTGRSSGKQRALPALHKDGTNVVVAVSNGGSDDHPRWFVNLLGTRKRRFESGRIAIVSAPGQPTIRKTRSSGRSSIRPTRPTETTAPGPPASPARHARALGQ